MRICEECDQAVPTHDIFFKLYVWLQEKKRGKRSAASVYNSEKGGFTRFILSLKIYVPCLFWYEK
jgi:hypothetical protein